MIWFEKQTIRFKDWIWAWMNVWWDHLGLNLWEHWPNALEGVWGQIRVGLPRVLTMDLNLRNLWRSSSPWLLDPLLLRQPKGHFVVLERTFTLRTLTFTILMKYWNKHRHISFPITEQGEENKVCGTLFEARKVAGSATNEQSKTWWNCLLSSVCLFSLFHHRKKKNQSIKIFLLWLKCFPINPHSGTLITSAIVLFFFTLTRCSLGIISMVSCAPAFI